MKSLKLQSYHDNKTLTRRNIKSTLSAKYDRIVNELENNKLLARKEKIRRFRFNDLDKVCNKLFLELGI